MNKAVKLTIAAGYAAVYFVLLSYILPSQEPYFFLGIALIGLYAWLFGIPAGILCSVLLYPATIYIYDQFEVSASFTNYAASPAYIAIQLLTAVTMGRFRKITLQASKAKTELEQANSNLQSSLAQVQELGGIHSLCSSCKKIKSDDGEWLQIDTYLKEKTKVEFSHGICPDCSVRYKEQQVKA